MRSGVFFTKAPRDFEIIQQNKNGCADIALEGYWAMEEAYETAEVYVRLLEQNAGLAVIGYTKARQEGSRWWATLNNVPAGGLYRIETGLCINGNPRLDWNLAGEMRHFTGVGDVYLLAGQSNSAGYGKGPLAEAPELGVHALGYNEQWRVATHPLGDSTGAVRLQSLEAANQGTSPYLHFGKLLRQALGYPIGLVPTALGGSPLREWNPEESGVLYRNAQEIAGLLTNGYKAVLWYQGCSDTSPGDSKTYLSRFAAMVRHWREDADAPMLPFLTVQLNRCKGAAPQGENAGWGTVREAQRQAVEAVEHCYAITATDIPLSDGIHNSAAGNVLLGERLARLALDALYHRGGRFRPANLVEAVQSGAAELTLRFDTPELLLNSLDESAEKLDFTLEDEKGLNALAAYEFTPGAARLFLERPLVGPCVLSCGDGKDVLRTVPVDFETYMPMFSFYKLPVRAESPAGSRGR